MLRRKFLYLASAAAGSVATGSALAACAGTDSTSTNGDNGGESGGGTGDAASGSGDKLNLKFLSNHPAGSKDLEQELISRFEEAHPDITVDLIDGGLNYEETAQQFNAALSGNDLPDVVVLSDLWWNNFALNDQIVNVDELAEKADIDTSTYVESLYADYELDGKHYAMPYARSTPLFYYNKDAWEAAGLPDEGPETWQQMEEWAAKLAEANENMTPFGWPDARDYLVWVFQGPLWTLGGQYSDEWDLKMTSQETIDGVQWLQDSTDPDNGFAYLGNDIASDFSAGLVAATVLSTGDLAGVTEDAGFEVGTAFLPNPNGDGGCPTGGAGLAIPSGISEERQLAAVKFIDFMTNDESTSYWSQNLGYMPVRSTAVDDPDQQAFMEENPNFRTAIEQLPETRPQDYARVFLPGAEKEIGGGFERIITNREDVEPVLNDVENALQRIYDSQVEPLL